MRKLLLVLTIFLLLKPASAYALEFNPQEEDKLKTLETINNSVVGEHVEDFQTDITINNDGTIDVKETIKYLFDTERHGIFRNIPYTKYDKGVRYDLDFKFTAVTDENGKKYQYEKSKSNEQWVLKIGDPNKTINGTHTYVITYTVGGALGYFNDHDEIFWNVTGNGWNVPIKKTTATIILPTKISEDTLKLSCYTGPSGSTKQNCIGKSDDRTSTFSTILFLNSYEGLTIVKGFPKGTTAVLLPEKYVPFSERWYGKITIIGIIIAAIFWYLILPIYLVFRWYAKGRDPFVGIPVTATFDPPRVEERTRVEAGPPKIGKRFLTPAESGALIDEHVDKRDLFATIIDLARRGHLKISEPKEKEFHLIKTTPNKKDALLLFEQTLYDGIFSGETDIKLKDVKFYTTAAKAETELYHLLVEHKYFPKNPRTTRNIYYGLGAAGMFTFNWILAFVAFLFGRFMPRKTLLGAQISNQTKGLKNFLSSQERQLNFQGDKQMMFEKLLPYAAAFGVEKAWAKRFEAFDLKSPDWYEGSTGKSFNTYLFASHLSNSYSSFAASSTPPSSSGSGFSGGSSGGGGGGGGGGSW